MSLAIPFLVAMAMMIKIVQPQGDHTSYLVLAPYPTPRLFYRGGEEGAWKRAHPGRREPWWLRGAYIVISEVTDS